MQWYVDYFSGLFYLIIDREAGEIIRSVASICLSVCLSVRYDFPTGAEWSIVVLGLAKYSKESDETQVQKDLPLPVQGLSLCL